MAAHRFSAATNTRRYTCTNSGSRTYRASLYRQDITNAAMTMAAPAGFFSGGDVLPDLFSNSSVLNAGTFQSTGVAVSATQNLGSNASATLIYGDAGALTTDKNELVSHSPDELRAMIREGRRQSVTARISATVPHSGTHLMASYQWMGDQPRSDGRKSLLHRGHAAACPG